MFREYNYTHYAESFLRYVVSMLRNLIHISLLIVESDV